MKYGNTSSIWDSEVEDFLRKLAYPRYYRDEVVEYGYLRGIEPYLYVKDIFDRYEHYTLLIPE